MPTKHLFPPSPSTTCHVARLRHLTYSSMLHQDLFAIVAPRAGRWDVFRRVNCCRDSRGGGWLGGRKGKAIFFPRVLFPQQLKWEGAMQCTWNAKCLYRVGGEGWPGKLPAATRAGPRGDVSVPRGQLGVIKNNNNKLSVHLYTRRLEEVHV